MVNWSLTHYNKRARQAGIMGALTATGRYYLSNRNQIHDYARQGSHALTRARAALQNLRAQRIERFAQNNAMRAVDARQGNLRGGDRGQAMEVTPAKSGRPSLIKSNMSRPVAVSLQANRQNKYRNVKKRYGSAAHRFKELYDTFFPKATYRIHAQCRFQEFTQKVTHINSTETAMNGAGAPKSFGCIGSEAPWQGVWTTTFRTRDELGQIWKQGFNMFPNTALKMLTSTIVSNGALAVGERLDSANGLNLGGTDANSRIQLVSGTASAGATNVTSDANDNPQSMVLNDRSNVDPRTGTNHKADNYETTALLQDTLTMQWVNGTEARCMLETWELMPKHAHSLTPEECWQQDLDNYGLASYLAMPQLPADTLINGKIWATTATRTESITRVNGSTATYTGKHDLAYRIGARPKGKVFSRHWKVVRTSKISFNAGETGTYVTNLPPIRDAGAAYRTNTDVFLPGVSKVFMFFCHGEKRLFNDDLVVNPPGTSEDHALARVTTMNTQALFYHKYSRVMTFQGAPSRRKNQRCVIGSTFTSPQHILQGYVDKPGYIITPFPNQIENDGAHSRTAARLNDGDEGGLNP